VGGNCSEAWEQFWLDIVQLIHSCLTYVVFKSRSRVEGYYRQI